mgnify:CR=1 FL=1
MNKQDFIKNIKEAVIDPRKSILSTFSDDQKSKKFNDNLKNVTNSFKQLKDMGVLGEDIDETLDMSRDYGSKDDFYKDMIDQLMYKYYGVTYFDAPPKEEKPKPEPKEPSNNPQLKLFPDKEKTQYIEPEEEIKPISQMSPEEYEEFTRQRGLYGSYNIFHVINLIKKSENQKNGTDNTGYQVNDPLRRAYLALQDTKTIREEEKINEENFANSNIFRIIAESETPKITKGEIIEFLNAK